VCHGDACAPNTLLDDDGRWTAHVDLGTLGLADRWADLAVASMSLDWNFGEGWQPEFFAAYGVRPDADRIRFYRALWNAPEL
jgi:kanamycin kinase